MTGREQPAQSNWRFGEPSCYPLLVLVLVCQTSVQIPQEFRRTLPQYHAGDTTGHTVRHAAFDRVAAANVKFFHVGRLKENPLAGKTKKSVAVNYRQL